MQEETDIVLSAIRRGVGSRPALSRETGLDYSRLELILHNLQFEWLAIDKTETADGFDRYSTRGSEKLGYIKTEQNGRSHTSKSDTTEPDTSKPITSKERGTLSISHTVEDLVDDWPDGVEISQPLITQRIFEDHPDVKPLADQLQLKAQVAGALSRLAKRSVLTVKVKSVGSAPTTFEKSPSPARTSAETVAKVQKMLGAAPEAVEEAIMDANAAVMEAIAPEFERDAFCLRNCDPSGVGHHYKCTYFPVNRPQTSPMGDKSEVRSGCEVTMDGNLQFNIEVRVAFDELATWSPMRISRFFEGIAKVVKAGE